MFKQHYVTLYNKYFFIIDNYFYDTFFKLNRDLMNKRKITNIALIVCTIIGIFFLIKYDVIGKLYDIIDLQVAQNKSGQESDGTRKEKIYETVLDEDGNEFIIEMEKIIVEDEEGNEVEMYVDTAEPIIIYDHMYKGEITKIEYNKIYFTVDLEIKEGTDHSFENVKDYEIIFDIDTYNLEFDHNSEYSVNDSLVYNYECFYKADDLQDIVGKYLRVTDTGLEDNYTGKRYKSLTFFNE